MLSIKDSLKTGALAGVLWGWLCYLANYFSGIFPFESSFTQNLLSFTFGGAVFGIVTAGLLAVLGGFLPFRRMVFKAVFISVTLWLALKFAGDILSIMEPERFHMVMPQAVQGILLALALGAILGLLLGRGRQAAAGNA
ncbi:MAG TPA: hypothetical protein DDW94_09295 [Deltaproteobacteria bacterium]|nr:MAG: hypothetical protein A2Z79_03790 [Deltaproteobacteria bacterium GWA2_55_82]OIJ74503.1 MAG: hypothetical protein A2V21_309690 [Deltaproteobacteria bacterium GWC2_55_46]HBG47166.1 hypothetical protein [Deltaproteobacteria bacterium]HCY10773.1 hypothetical protein [Deltaproteobacteria bacterium]